MLACLMHWCTALLAKELHQQATQPPQRLCSACVTHTREIEPRGDDSMKNVRSFLAILRARAAKPLRVLGWAR